MRGAERIAVGTLLFGPGERLEDLMTLVRASAPGASVRQIADLDELSESRGDEGLLLVDADVLPAEDVGYLRRFLARETEFQLTLVGEDSSRRVARTLLRLPRVQWLGWPPDLEDLRGLVGPARGAARTIPAAAPQHPWRSEAARPQRSAPSKAPAVHEGVAGDELARIEAILDLPEEAGADVEAPPSASRATADAQPSAPPPYFKDQVADLADITQRIDGAVTLLRGTDGGAAGEELEALSGDVARLVQFTRTLSYLSSAPPQGDQVFDLAELVETLVAGLPKKGPKAPRWLARSSGPLFVSSDRELLMQVFDALLFVAEKCSARGEIVRVQAAESKAAGPGRATVTIEFSSGPLEELDPARAVEPYALRRILPDLGPNALSAARGIVAGQGGRLALERSGRGRMTWTMELPLTEAPAAIAAPAQEHRQPAVEAEKPGHAPRGAADPFA
jgi:hypothetical protein